MAGRVVVVVVVAAVVVAVGAETGLRWDPYGGAKGGSIAACGGVDFALVAADAQLTSGYRISSSTSSRLSMVSDRVALGVGGCVADCDGLRRALRDRCDAYADFRGPPDAAAACRACSRALYARRHFPYGVAPVVAGLDAAGRGRAWALDALGSAAEGAAVAGGNAAPLLQPVLDRLAPRRRPGHGGGAPAFDDVADARAAVLEAFRAAARRDSTVGDVVDLAVITRAGVARETLRLAP